MLARESRLCFKKIAQCAETSFLKVQRSVCEPRSAQVYVDVRVPRNVDRRLSLTKGLQFETPAIDVQSSDDDISRRNRKRQTSKHELC